MNLTIDLSDQSAAALEAQARAARMPAELSLERRHREDVERLDRHLEEMASEADSSTSGEALEAALEEALAAVRSKRNWRP